MKQKKCRPREYYSVDHRGQFWYGFKCKHLPSNSFKTKEELERAVKIHRKETKP